MPQQSGTSNCVRFTAASLSTNTTICPRRPQLLAVTRALSSRAADVIRPTRLQLSHAPPGPPTSNHTLANVGQHHFSLAACPAPARCICPFPAPPSLTLARPCWPSAVFPPRSTTTIWPTLPTPARQYLPHIRPRTLTSAAGTI